MVNYYSILNLSPSASKKEIEEAFRKLAHKYHPDKNKGNLVSSKKFQRILEAYQALQNPQLRKELQAYLNENKTKVTKPNEKKLDLEVQLEVSIEDVFKKKELILKYTRPLKGKKTDSEVLVQLPPQIKSGDKLKFKGFGGGLGDRLFGDLYVKITFKPHPYFQIKNRDILLSWSLPYNQALQGTEITIPGLESQLLVEVPKTKKPTSLRLKSQGLIKNKQGERGDMIVKIFIDYSKETRKE